MTSLNSSQVLEKLAALSRTYWLQDFTFTSEQAAQYKVLRQARWARVREMTSAS